MDSALSAWVARITRATGIRYMKASPTYELWRRAFVDSLEVNTAAYYCDARTRNQHLVCLWNVDAASLVLDARSLVVLPMPVRMVRDR